ncbi:MAG: prephenate dehydrogenase/arogenate dehydrogenase family protein [Gammaproteobacteria bacterium]|nr:prephenate dehydrogenase/arogenate dehydrogenase family protein [Gammaproteobacteria bacterium]
MIERLCIIGVGLIGGSLARDLRRLGLCDEFVGCSRNAANLERARELGIIDRFALDPAEAVRGADAVVLSVPLGAMTDIMKALRPGLGDGTVLSDVGSAKRSVIESAKTAFDAVPGNFVPAHPIAGTEHSGVEAAVDGLFEGRRVILTPLEQTRPAALERVRAMWEGVGSEVLEMDAEHHDQVLAATSHLPHMLAYTLVDMLGRMQERVEMFRYAAGGFRDFTRIASSDAQMWHDICLANRDALLAALTHFHADLDNAIETLRNGDGESLKALFARAKALRDRYARESDVR